MAFIAPILEAAVRDREDWEAEDDPAVLSTREGLAVDLAATHYMTTEDFPTSTPPGAAGRPAARHRSARRLDRGKPLSALAEGRAASLSR